jgi:preprotein translocase subunit YajC
MGQLLILPLMIVVMYFLLIRPQQRRMKAQQDLLRAIGDGDEVITASGMYGFVTAIEGDTVWLEIAEGVDIRVSKSAIARKLDSAASGADAAHDTRPETADTAEHPEGEGDR